MLKNCKIFCAQPDSNSRLSPNQEGEEEDGGGESAGRDATQVTEVEAEEWNEKCRVPESTQRRQLRFHHLPASRRGVGGAAGSLD